MRTTKMLERSNKSKETCDIVIIFSLLIDYFMTHSCTGTNAAEYRKRYRLWRGTEVMLMDMKVGMD